MASALTDRQKKALRRMLKDASEEAALSRDLGKQLAKKRLAYDTMRTFERMEFHRVIARLPIYALTPAGRAVAEELRTELGATEEV